jgi:flagellar biosynthesis protein FlhA
MRQALHNDQLALGAVPLTRLIESISKAWKDAERRQQPLAILVDQSLRRPMKKLLARTAPELGVIAYQEVPNDVVIDSVAMLPHDDILGPEQNSDGSMRPGSTETAGIRREAA